MPDATNPKDKKSPTALILPLVIFSVGLIVGILIKQPSRADVTDSNRFVSSNAADTANTNDISCSQDLPVVAPILWRESYTLAYDGRSKNPYWVQEILTKDSISSTKQYKKCSFRPDPQLPSNLRAHPEDYSKTGFEHGHMAFAINNLDTPGADEESHLMSNACPQCPHLMRGYWVEMDKNIKAKAQVCDEVKVITGPLYLPKVGEDGKKYVHYLVIGDNDVAVPTHFFRIITSRTWDKTETEAYIIPNEDIPKDTPLDQFKADIQQIEKVSGIVFST